MKVNVPRSYAALPKGEQNRIKEMMHNVAMNQIEQSETMIQKRLIKLTCIILHEVNGLSDDDLMLYLSGFKRKYRKLGGTEADSEIDQYLNGEIEKIFGEGKYPESWFDKI